MELENKKHSVKIPAHKFFYEWNKVDHQLHTGTTVIFWAQGTVNVLRTIHSQLQFNIQHAEWERIVCWKTTE